MLVCFSVWLIGSYCVYACSSVWLILIWIYLCLFVFLSGCLCVFVCVCVFPFHASLHLSVFQSACLSVRLLYVLCESFCLFMFSAKLCLVLRYYIRSCVITISVLLPLLPALDRNKYYFILSIFIWLIKLIKKKLNRNERLENIQHRYNSTEWNHISVTWYFYHIWIQKISPKIELLNCTLCAPRPN